MARVAVGAWPPPDPPSLSAQCDAEKGRKYSNDPQQLATPAAALSTALSHHPEPSLRPWPNVHRWDVVKAVILASPGFTKDQLFKYIMEEVCGVVLQNAGRVPCSFLMKTLGGPLTQVGLLHATCTSLADWLERRILHMLRVPGVKHRSQFSFKNWLGTTGSDQIGGFSSWPLFGPSASLQIPQMPDPWPGNGWRINIQNFSDYGGS